MNIATISNDVERPVGYEHGNELSFTPIKLHIDTKFQAEPQAQIRKVIQRSSRIILSEQDACAIFQNKPPNGDRHLRRADMLASLYGVSVKTIRDIWIGRTWYRSTCHLDPSKPVNVHRLQCKPGRPLGAKDSKPRVVQPTRRVTPPYLANSDVRSVSDSASSLSAPPPFADVWRKASTPLADWLDGGSWAASAGWDDPFHDDWPFWNRNG